MLTAAQRDDVLGRLDRDHIDAIANGVRHQLRMDSIARCDYQPGDGTSYRLVVIDLNGASLVVGGEGGGTLGYPPATPYSFARVLVVYEQRGTAAAVYSVDQHAIGEAAGQLTDNAAGQLAIGELLLALLGVE